MKIEKFEKHVYIQNWKGELRHDLILKIVYKIIEYNQSNLTKTVYTIYWYEHRSKKTSKRWFWKRFFFKSMNNEFLE